MEVGVFSGLLHDPNQVAGQSFVLELVGECRVEQHKATVAHKFDGLTGLGSIEHLLEFLSRQHMTGDV